MGHVPYGRPPPGRSIGRGRPPPRRRHMSREMSQSNYYDDDSYEDNRLPPGYDEYELPPDDHDPDYDLEKNSKFTGGHINHASVRPHSFTKKTLFGAAVALLVLGFFSGFGMALVFLEPIVRVMEAIRGELYITASILVGYDLLRGLVFK